MSVFRESLPSIPAGSRRWLYVPYDQLTASVGPLSDAPPEELGIVMVESAHKASRRPYHKQKLALVLTNQRHFALEQAQRGVAVDYRMSERPYADVLREVCEARGPLEMMEAAERELRQELAPLVEAGALTVVPHAGWLTSADDFPDGPPWRMDVFYRRVRRRTGWLMEGGAPEGGRFSFDGDNRKRWSGTPAAPDVPRFVPDALTLEVAELVRRRFSSHPGRLDPGALPASVEDAERLWAWALAECMTSFGPYEDAMSRRSRSLFHTRVAPLLNLHRLLPERVVSDVAGCDAPLNSREGFVRQVLGWREFVRHVHRATDGFRRGTSDPLGRTADLIPAYWEGAPSGWDCLDTAVEAVWDEGYTHHIPRLMVLSNLATLLDLSPAQLSSWFWVGFTDAYDWVVEPNVIGMGTFGAGDVMTTKPYVSGAGYIAKMGDYCKGCAFDPKRTCPITPLYWAFLARHESALSDVERMRLPLASLRRRAADKRRSDAATFERVRAVLDAGETLTPARLEDPWD